MQRSRDGLCGKRVVMGWGAGGTAAGDGSSPDHQGLLDYWTLDFILSEMRSRWRVLSRKVIVLCFKDYFSHCYISVL